MSATSKPVERKSVGRGKLPFKAVVKYLDLYKESETPTTEAKLQRAINRQLLALHKEGRQVFDVSVFEFNHAPFALFKVDDVNDLWAER